MISRFARTAAAVAMMVGLLAGCTSQPAPTPTPTSAFASDEEAFAAAEETYRAYVDALNAVDLADPQTFEDVFAWTTGDANANEREGLSGMHADGLSVSGQTVMKAFYPMTAELVGDETVVIAVVCSDVSAVDVTDSNGQSTVSSDRPDVYAVRVEIIESARSTTSLLITSSNAVEDSRCESP